MVLLGASNNGRNVLEIFREESNSKGGYLGQSAQFDEQNVSLLALVWTLVYFVNCIAK